MQVSIIGAGYVGLVTGACLADLGHEVMIMDIDRERIEKLEKGIIPIHEPGLDRLIQKNSLEGRLLFTTDLIEAVEHSVLSFICVWTPPQPDGRADLSAVRKVGRDLGAIFAKKKTQSPIVAIKSTVPVGTGREVGKIIAKFFKGKLAIVSNPEFLREGQAVADMMHPDRIVIGGEDEAAVKKVMELFAGIRSEIIITDLPTAEMIKYAANAFLATKISFINEVANVCERVGADVDMVAAGIGSDSRIGPSFLRAGLGYGGSCFPKDVRALQQFANKGGYDFKLLKSVIEVNEQQRGLIIKKLVKHLKNLPGKQVMVLGLAFKSNTDDIRESAAIDVVSRLIKHGVKIRVFDPAALLNARKILGDTVEYLSHPQGGAAGLDAVVIATEWPEFRELDWPAIQNAMRKPFIIDGRNLLNAPAMRAMGFIYEGVGR